MVGRARDSGLCARSGRFKAKCLDCVCERKGEKSRLQFAK